MIERLYIKNYLIIKESEIDFIKGLNILTGETGAGKSIIIDALSLILGERADYTKIKKNEEKLIVEAHFNFKNKKVVINALKKIVQEDDLNSENVIIRRELSKKGTSRNFINDSPVNTSDMKEIGDMIIDIHSQNEHQSLLNKETHIELLDNYSLPPEKSKNYRKEFNELKELITRYNNISSRKEEYSAKRKFIEFELKEINNLNPSVGEDIDLENELTKLENAEDISIALNTALKFLSEDELNSYTGISMAIKELRKISGYDKGLEKTVEELENSLVLVKESSDSLSRFRNSLNFDNERIEEIRKRISEITHLKKKYGLTLDEIITKGEELQKELHLAENFDYEIEKILKSISEKRQTVFKEAEEINELRIKKSKVLEKNIYDIFKEIGLENGEFKVQITNVTGEEEDLLTVKKGKENLRLGSSGYNEIEFLIKTNKGSEFSPLRKSASGGEISRIMLAIKTVLSEKDNVGILVFDEIDAGISGRVAQKVGKILKTLSKTHQIICITHLPQIAAMSEKHFHVSKNGNKDETIAAIKNLTEEEKITEIAKLVSGENITESARKSAMELINS